MSNAACYPIKERHQNVIFCIQFIYRVTPRCDVEGQTTGVVIRHASHVLLGNVALDLSKYQFYYFEV